MSPLAVDTGLGIGFGISRPSNHPMGGGLDSAGTPTQDLLIGRPGQDLIQLGRHNRSDVVRVRGGGADHVNCLGFLDADDVLFVDRSDHISPGCKNAIVLLTERPRYPYP